MLFGSPSEIGILLTTARHIRTSTRTETRSTQSCSSGSRQMQAASLANMPSNVPAFVISLKPSASWHQRLLAGPLRRGFLVLVAGTGAGQALAVVVSPIVSRLYTPRDFGVLGLFVAVASVLAVAAALRYETVVVVPTDDIDAAEVFAAGCAAVLGLTLVCACVIWFSLAFGHVPTFLDSVRSLLWLLPISQLGVGWQSLFLNWALRKGAYGRIARAKLWQGIVLVSAQVALGGLGCGAVGLVVAFVLSQGAGMTQLARVCWPDHKELLGRLEINRVWQRAIHYWRFPVYSVPASLMNAVGTNVPQIAISILFGTVVGGAYDFAMPVFMKPGRLVPQSLAQMYSAE